MVEGRQSMIESRLKYSNLHFDFIPSPLTFSPSTFFRLPHSDFRLPISDFCLLTSVLCLYPIHSAFYPVHLRFRISNSALCFTIPHSKIHNRNLPPSPFIFPTSAFRIPTSIFRLFTNHGFGVIFVSFWPGRVVHTITNFRSRKWSTSKYVF